MPSDLIERPWGDLDVLGWRDPASSQRAYLVAETGSGLVGVAMRLASSNALERGYDPKTSPKAPRTVPWWLLTAGVLFGPARGVKWSALFFLPLFAVMIVVWRVQARRSAGVRQPFVAGILSDLGWGLLSFVLAATFYLAT